MRKLSISFMALMLLAGCYSPPRAHEFEAERVYALQKDAVWSNLMDWLTSHRVQIKTVEKDSGIIYAERAYTGSVPVFSYADCGMAGEQAISPQSAQFNIYVREVGPRSTRVSVNATYSAVFVNPVNNTSQNITCTSRGDLETDILNAADGEQVKH